MVESVFINCPFDADYQPLFYAAVFTLHDCGYQPRCALESSNGGEVRIDKIYRLIEHCKLGIHDISRIQLDRGSNLPRFNMALELGIFLGAQRFGDAVQQAKSCLILSDAPFQYQAYLSDIAGQDIRHHANETHKICTTVRDWLNQFSASILPGGARIFERFEGFLESLGQVSAQYHISIPELNHNDYTTLVAQWLSDNPR